MKSYRSLMESYRSLMESDGINQCFRGFNTLWCSLCLSKYYCCYPSLKISPRMLNLVEN